MLLDHCTGIVPGSPQQLVRFPWEVLKKTKSVCACEMLSQNKTSSPFPLLPHPACCRPPQNVFCSVRPFSRTLSLQAWRGQMKP